MGKINGKKGSKRIERFESRELKHPRSIWMKRELKLERYFELAKLADLHSYNPKTSATPHSETEEEVSTRKHHEYRRLCKAVLECDRNQAAFEEGYSVYLGKLWPLDCSTKNDVLLGFPRKR